MIEEQLRRAAFLNLNMNNSSQNVIIDPMSGATGSVLALNTKFSELETLADSHYHLSTQSANGNKPANDVLKRVLVQLEELLNDMKQEVNRIPVSLTRLAPVTERLKMQERDILNKLAHAHQSNSNAAGQSEESKMSNDPYYKFAHYIGGFAPKVQTHVAYNPNKENKSQDKDKDKDKEKEKEKNESLKAQPSNENVKAN
jgi:hypothetical protein